jgi:hypothetical protein
VNDEALSDAVLAAAIAYVAAAALVVVGILGFLAHRGLT